MSFETLNEDGHQTRRGGKLRGVPGSGGETADESGGRSTGVMTGFGGGQMRYGGSQGVGGGGGSGGGTRAVVKGHYVRTGNTKNIKASARYLTTRENERGEEMERPMFSNDSDELERKAYYERIEQADHEYAYAYRLVVSPGTDQDAEDVDLKDYTRTVMEEVEKLQHGRVSYIAAEHAGDGAHTDRAHAHVIMYSNDTLDEKDFAQLREHATRSFDEAREEGRSLDRDATIRDDTRALAELSERQRERALGRGDGEDNQERKLTREAEQDEPKREINVQRDEAPSSVEVEERDYGRNRGRDR